MFLNLERIGKDGGGFMKFKLGDKVSQVRIGNPFVGTIIGISTFGLWVQRDMLPIGKARVNEEGKLEFTSDLTWFKYNNDWPHDPMYYIKLDEAQPNLSFTEFCNHFGVPPTGVAEKVYNATSIKTNIVAHPEFDLALL